MATLEEIRAQRKKRDKEKADAKAKVRADRRKVITDMDKKYRTAKENREILKQKRKALRSDLSAEARLAESRTAKARGNTKKSDRKLATAERLKENQRLANAREKRVKNLRDLRKSGAKPAERLKAAQKNLPGYGNNKSAPAAKKAPAAKNKSKATRAPGSEGYKPIKTNMGPNMAKVNRPDPKPAAKKADVKKPARRKGPSGPTMTSMGRPSTGPKPRNKDPKQDRKKSARNQMKSARASMGFKKGGSIDGCATKGHTRAKRSR